MHEVASLLENQMEALSLSEQQSVPGGKYKVLSIMALFLPFIFEFEFLLHYPNLIVLAFFLF